MNDVTPEATPPPSPPPPAKAAWKKWTRLGITLAAVAVLWIVAERTGLRKNASPERLHALMQRAGAWGGIAYIGAFVVGNLLQVPGTIFLLAARVAYGALGGGLIAYVGSLAAVTVSFFFARTLGGRAFDQIRWKPVQRLLSRLHDRPVLTIALLRTILWMSPPLNYALAMSTVRFRDYFVGSALGLALPVATVIVFSQWLLGLVARFS